MSETAGAVWGFVGAILGSLIGGGLSIWASHQAVWTAERRQRRSLAATLLGELLSAHSTNVDPKGGIANILRQWGENGDYPNREYWASVYDIDPADAYPVFLTSVNSIGLLGAELAQRLVKYHSGAIALSLLGSRAIRAEIAQPLRLVLSQLIEQRTAELKAERTELIAELQKIAGE